MPDGSGNRPQSEIESRLMAAATAVLRGRPQGWDEAQRRLLAALRGDEEAILMAFEPFKGKALSRLITKAIENGAPEPEPPAFIKPPSAQTRRRWKEQAAKWAAFQKAETVVLRNLALMRAKAEFFDAWLLSSGGSLLDANAKQLRAEIEYEQIEVEEHRRKSRFYTRLLDALSPGQRVRDIPLERLLALREEAFAAIPPLTRAPSKPPRL